MKRLEKIEARMAASPGQEISLADPDARSMVTSGSGSGTVGYNVQAVVDTEYHLIIAHEVTNVGNDTSQSSPMAKKAKAVLEVEKLDVVANRGYFKSAEILACEQDGITVTLPKPQTSGGKARGLFVKVNFCYLPENDTYICPADEVLDFVSHKRETGGLNMGRYGTRPCATCELRRLPETTD